MEVKYKALIDLSFPFPPFKVAKDDTITFNMKGKDNWFRMFVIRNPNLFRKIEEDEERIKMAKRLREAYADYYPENWDMLLDTTKCSYLRLADYVLNRFYPKEEIINALNLAINSSNTVPDFKVKFMQKLEEIKEK